MSNERKNEGQLRILLFDFETFPNMSYHWQGKHEQEIIKIIKEGFIMSIAYKWLGEKTIRCFNLGQYKYNNKKFIEEIWKLFDEADVVIAHNGNQFDVKMANREFVKYGILPPSPYKQIDTLTIARSKFKFNSNRLDDLGEYLGLGRKLPHEGFPLWEACMRNERSAWKKMTQYNKQDVNLLEQVYLRLRPYTNTHPVMATDNEFICPICGSHNVQSRGWSITNVFKKKRHQCTDCGKWFLGMSIRYKDKENVLI